MGTDPGEVVSSRRAWVWSHRGSRESPCPGGQASPGLPIQCRREGWGRDTGLKGRKTSVGTWPFIYISKEMSRHVQLLLTRVTAASVLLFLLVPASSNKSVTNRHFLGVTGTFIIYSLVSGSVWSPSLSLFTDLTSI